MRTRIDILLAVVIWGSIAANNAAFAIEAWHPRLGELADKSELIVVGSVLNVSNRTVHDGFNQSSTVKVSAVLKGKKDLSVLQLVDSHEPNVVCPRIVGVQPQRSYILFLTPFDRKTNTYKPIEYRGAKLLPEDPKQHEKIFGVLRRHIAYMQSAEKASNDLKEIVLDELESETLFEVGFSTLFYAQMENQELLNAMKEEDQIRIFEAFNGKQFWYMDWANLTGILFHIEKRSPELIKLIARKLSSEQNATGPFGDPIFTGYKYFYAMCLVDASTKSDLGTGIPETGDPFDHVLKWKKYSVDQKKSIITGFFEKLDTALPGWNKSVQEGGFQDK